MAERDAESGTTAAQTTPHDVFISYASRDIGVANDVSAVLEDQGLKCWIAPRDVTPGAHYASEIVHAIDSAKAIVLILSQDAAASPHVLSEIERATSKRHPVVTLRVDQAPLPAEFQYFLNTSQWLDASEGDTVRAMPKLLAAVRLAIEKPRVTPGDAVLESSPTPIPGLPAPSSKTPGIGLKGVLVMAVALFAAGMLYLLADKFWLSRRGPMITTLPTNAMPPPTAAPPVFSPPVHSVAVLPFVNMSGDPTEDYFSDGLSEELLNSLAAVPGLQVAARTSAFSFKGKQVDVSEIAHKLNVAAVLEGSVRKEGQHVRITAQLINAVTGYDLWSQTYDRDLKGILKLQSEVARQVGSALQTTLLATADAALEDGGTENPLAFDAYLRAARLGTRHTSISRTLSKISDYVAAQSAAVNAYTEAIQLDPRYASAYAGKALALIEVQRFTPDSLTTGRKAANDALLAARRATALADHLGFAHAALADVLARSFFDFSAATVEYERALVLAPGDARVLTHAAVFLGQMGRYDEALPHALRAAELDPLNVDTQFALVEFYDAAGRYQEALHVEDRAFELAPQSAFGHAGQGLEYLQLGDLGAALKACSTPPIEQVNHQMCLAIVYYKLSRRAEADTAMAAIRAEGRDAFAYQYSEIYAQWGDIPKALDWLENAYRLRDAGLVWLKTDGLMDPLRKEARFQAVYTKLKFPN